MPAGAGDITRQRLGRRGCGRGEGLRPHGRQHLRRVAAAPGGRHEHGANRFGQVQGPGQEQGGIFAGRPVDAPLQVADGPRAQVSRFRQLPLGQSGLRPQLPQQPAELRCRRFHHVPDVPFAGPHPPNGNLARQTGQHQHYAGPRGLTTGHSARPQRPGGATADVILWVLLWVVTCGDQPRREPPLNQSGRSLRPVPSGQEMTVFLPLSRRGAHVAADQNWPAPTAAVSRWRAMTMPGCYRTPSTSALTAGATPPGSGSAATATRRCAAPGACPAGRTWTRPAITSGRSIFSTFGNRGVRLGGGRRGPTGVPVRA